MIKQIVIFIAIAQTALAFPQDVVEKIMEEPMDEMDSDPIVKGREPRIDTNCEGILTPMNPDCCFMTDPDHERTKPFGQPLENSPYKINLVAVEKKQLNKFEKSTFNDSDMWTLTPLMDQAQNNVEEELMEGGPIRLQVSIRKCQLSLSQKIVLNCFALKESDLISCIYIDSSTMILPKKDSINFGFKQRSLLPRTHGILQEILLKSQILLFIQI